MGLENPLMGRAFFHGACAGDMCPHCPRPSGVLVSQTLRCPRTSCTGGRIYLDPHEHVAKVIDSRGLERFRIIKCFELRCDHCSRAIMSNDAGGITRTLFPDHLLIEWGAPTRKLAQARAGSVVYLSVEGKPQRGVEKRCLAVTT